jgi:hypothetical protein
MTPETPQHSDAESFVSSPEIAAAPYAHVKSIEQHIEAQRSQADESVLIRNRISRIFQPVLKRIVAPVSSDSLERRLVDCESEIGGALFPQLPGTLSQRFWYHNNDWFYEQADQRGSTTALYHVEPHAIEKLVNGRVAPFDETEKQHLLASIPRYQERISEELYGTVSRHTSNFDLAA